MVADGKYVLKSVFKGLNKTIDENQKKSVKFDIKENESYFEPIFLVMKNENEDSISIKIEDDYILDIKKIDINEGNQVIYMQNVISELDFTLKSYKKKKTSSNSVIKKITQYITFFMEYLLNIDYTFKDDNYEMNHSIKERQLLLDKYNILDTLLEIINYFLPTVKDIKLRDLTISRKKSKKKTNIYNNRINNEDKIKESLKISLQPNETEEKDSAISNMKSMIKLILKFLLHLSENNEDIKIKIFIKLSPILEFSEYIYPKDRSDLLNFIFEILKDSELLQEYIVVGKLKIKNKIVKHDKVLFIDKILAYIETTYNYLYFYKKLMHLNKIRYKTEEIKEKIKAHIKKVQRDFNIRKRMQYENLKLSKNLSNNYKGIIYMAIKTLKILVIGQIRELNKYLEGRKDNNQQEKVDYNNNNLKKIKRGKTNFFDKNEKKEQQTKYKSTKRVNFAINNIKGMNTLSSNKIGNLRKVDLNEKNENNIDEKLMSPSKLEDIEEAESNDYLNNNTPLKQKKPGILVKSSIKNNMLAESSNNNIINLSKDPSINNDINRNQENDFAYIYSIKNGEDDFCAYAEKKISDLKFILRFLKYFQAIKFNILLFQKDNFFKDIFGKDIKEEFLENNLNFVINGDSTTINFINGVEYNSNSLLAPLFPFRLFNQFFPTFDDSLENLDTKNIIEGIDEVLSEEDIEENEEEEENITKNHINKKNNIKNSLLLSHHNKSQDEDNDEESDKNSINNDSKDFDFSESKSSEKEEKKNIESPVPKKKLDILNFSSIKNSNKDKDNISIKSKDKNEIKGSESRKIERKASKHQTVNVISKGILFESKLKKLLSNEPKKNEYQKIYEKCKEEEQEINRYLYILYSIYFFCINEFMEIIYKTYTILFNYCINYDYFSDLNAINSGLNFIKQNLLPRVIFINNNNFIKNIYNKIIINPSLLNDTFNIENFNIIDNKNDGMNANENENDDENNNINTNINENKLDNKKTKFNRGSGNDFNNKDNKLLFDGNEFTKLKVLTNEEIILIDFLIYFCKKNDQINYLLEKIEFFKKLKILINEIEPQINEENQEDKKPINNNLLKLINIAKLNIKMRKPLTEDKKEEEPKEKIKKAFKDILENLVKKRSYILIKYEKLCEVKNQFLYFYKNSLCTNDMDDYGIEKQAHFMIQLLKQYEIENYFNKIIYLEIKNNSIFHDKNSFDKLMNIQEVFKNIEREIQKIKEENETDNKDDTSSMIDTSFSPRKIIQNKNIGIHYKNLNNKLKSITKKLLNIFSIKDKGKEGVIKLIEMLIKENENFFEKIGFANSLKIMVEFIKIYDEKKRINNTDSNEDNFILKLNFCKEILRVFIEVQSVFPKFYKLVPENYDIYKTMIINSLECIKEFQGNEKSNDNEEEKLFLCICYYCSESLLFLLKYCKKSFKDIRDFIAEVFKKLFNIYNIYKYPKNKVIFQLFYNYLVSRAIILFSNYKNDDSYESILNNIYPQKEMKDRVNECINELQKDEDYSNKGLDEEDDEEEEDEDEDEEDDENNDDEEEENEENKDSDILKKEKEKIEKDDDEDEDNNWKENLYVTKGRNTDSSNDEKNSKGEDKNLKDINNSYGGIFGITLQTNKRDKYLWEDEKEKEKLSFLLFFSSSYIIFLIDKNLGKIRNFLMFENEKTENYLEENNKYENKRLDSLSIRGSSFINLRSTNRKDEVNNSFANITNNIDRDKINKKSFITYGTKNNINNNNTNNTIIRLGNKTNFELILFESISNFKRGIKTKKIEIPVKNKIINKYENIYGNNGSNNDSNKSDDSKEEEIGKKYDSRAITFYYYDPNCLEKIILEKIFKDIEIKSNLKYYCTNYYTNEEYESLKKSNLLAQLLKLQNRFNSITYKEKEYDILKEQFIKNDMEQFIKKILKNFNQGDLEGNDKIDKMQDYIYNIMNEIYPHESLYDDYQSEKILSLIEYLKILEEEVQRENLKKCHENSRKEKIIIDKCFTHLAQYDLFKFFNSLIYLYPKYNEKICTIFYKIAFQLLHAKCSSVFSHLNKKNEKINSNSPQLILNGIILLFTREKNQSLIQSKNIFFIMVNSINLFLKNIQDNDHIKNYELIQSLFNKLGFVLDHLSNDFDKIFNFMKSPESQQITTKYKKMENSLNNLITFITTLIGFKKNNKNILTNDINNFSKKIIKKIIKLISNLLEKSQETSFQSIDLLLNFIYDFIDGPDIDNLNILFDFGYFDLVTYVIKRIDYYNLFLSNINKENLHEIIDKVIEIEYKIIKIFFIYYNICHHKYNRLIYTKLRYWYEENIESIKKKLKRIYYLSRKEMENKEYDIDKMLLSLKKNDSYTKEELKKRAATLNFNLENIDDLNDDKMFEENKNDNTEDSEQHKEIIENNIEENDNDLFKKENEDGSDKKKITKDNENNKNINNHKNKCLIKFDLILIYYTLFSYHQDSINEGYLSVPPKKNLLTAIIFFLKECYLFVKNIVLCIYYLGEKIYRQFPIKKENIELLQELSDIDKKCQNLDENEMFIFLTNRIKCVEVSLNYILYKIYFPLLNKAKKIQDNSETYLKIDNSQLSNYINYILSSYDKINLIATQDYKIDKFIEFPIINIVFKNDNLYSILLILIGIFINIIIMLSFSTFTSRCEDISITDPIKKRLSCPHLLYDDNNSEYSIKQALNYFGSLLVLLQCFLFFGYILRRFAHSYGLYINDYKKKKLSRQRSGSIFSYIVYFIPDILKIIFDFQTIYYLLSMFFMIMGLSFHPFFFCFALLELVNKVEIMQTVLKAMYVPMANILITLLMFIMLEYFFSMFALTKFTSHFPEISDSKNFLSTFLRMIDQTFKQDGGIGTYLDQTKDPKYEPYSAKFYAGGRFFFDLIFFLLVNTLIFQMFLSMIIDYFTTTKENKEEFQKLKESQCLICEIEREDLEKIYSNLKNAFDLHVNHFHSLIDYIAFLVFLQASNLKDPIIDKEVWKLHLSNNFKYLPKGTCFKKIEKKILEKNMKK